MKLSLLLSSFLILISINSIAQSIENPGFELWEDAGTVIDEPVNWSSIKTSDAGNFINNAAPVVWGQSEDAHSGNYSVELFNVASFGIIATGTVTNGRVHADFDPNVSYIYTNTEDPGWNTPFTGRPDSVIVWAKYIPAGTDTAQVKVLLHVNDGSLPPHPDNQENRIGYAQINISGTVDTWTRFGAKFNYSSQDNPEYILIVMTSGAGTIAVAGSTVFYDDIQLVGQASGINDQAFANAKLYAANSFIYLENFTGSLLEGANAEIYSLSGALLWSAPLDSQQTKIKTPLPQGLYVFKISGHAGIFSQKLFIK